MLLGPASAAVIAIVRAESTLACNPFIAREALTFTGGPVTDTLVGALNPGVQIVVVDNITDPSVVLGACSQRTISTSVLRLAINALETSAVVIEFASSMSRALVLAHACLAVAAFVPGMLSPRLLNIRRGRGRNRSGHTSGFATGLTGGLAAGFAAGNTAGIAGGFAGGLAAGFAAGNTAGITTGLTTGLTTGHTGGSRGTNSCTQKGKSQ